MMSEETIFNEALDFPPGKVRDEFVARACGDAPGLRKRINALLASHNDDEFILNRHNVTTELLANADTTLTESVGAQVDEYKLLQQIGQGGMGKVFMAQQVEPVQRKVALKIIKSGMDSHQVLRRFEAERQALARMDHPNITRVIDAGVSQSGRPYFVMELVRGTEITTYCDKNQVPVEERLRLFQQVCLALHHAHQKGIIHRDIKPSNIMVTMHDGVPVPKVIDFGIAKALDRPLTERTLFTNYGELIGTPEYMSPEQAEMSGLDLDVRSDVYSLGVLLFELLTGSTPLDVKDLQQKGLLKLFETIRDSEAETASQRLTKSNIPIDTIAQNRRTSAQLLGRLLKGDLDWIIAKALSKDRDRRYESAAALGRDIQRYLSGEPTEAAAPTIAYRTRKFVTKHKLVCAFAGALTAVLILGTATSVYFAIEAIAAQRLSARQLVDLAAEKRLSDQSRDRAESAQRRAELAEAEANRLSRERQNDAAVSRAMARFSMEQAPQLIRKQMTKAMTDFDPQAFEQFDGVVQVLTSPDTHGHPVMETTITSTNEIGSPIDRSITFDSLDAPETFIALQQFVLEEQRKEFGSADPIVAATLLQLGKLQLEREEFADSELCLREALGILAEQGPDHEQRQELLHCLVECLERQGKTEQAAEYRNRHQLR